MLITKIKDLVNNIRLFTPLNVAISIYILSVIILWSWGNFPISDDFYYLMQVQAFNMGILTKSALIGPTFILQAFIGLLWGKLFGITYISLRILTTIFSIFCIIGVDKILSLLNIRKSIRTLALLLVIFNPPFYACSVTFMSENYFLFFILFSIYNFLLFTKTNRTKNLILASILGGLSIMIRQYGVVLFVSYIFIYLLTALNSKQKSQSKLDIKKILQISIPFIFLGCLGIFWPKYTSLADPKSMDISLFFTNFEDIVSRIFNISLIPYIGFFLLPFTLPSFIKLKRNLKALILASSLALSYPIFKMNIFKIGNLFYLEGLYARLVPNIRENLFNNVPFKIFVAYLVSLSFITMLYYLVRELSKITRLKEFNIKNPKDLIPNIENSSNLTLFILLIGFYLIVMVTDRVFDRYLINFFIILIIFTAYQAERLNFNVGKLSVIMCLLISLVTFLLVYDYYKVNQLKWKLADRLSNEIGIDRYKIFLDNVYARTTYMNLMENYKGLHSAVPEDYHPYCFVQEYTSQDKNILNDFINFVEHQGVFGKKIFNPRVENAGKLSSLSNRFDTTDVLFFDESYPSPIYSLLGKRTFVRAFCLENYKELR